MTSLRTMQPHFHKIQRKFISSKSVKQNFSWISPLPTKAFITDVGPRDGLQNECKQNGHIIPVDIKLELIHKLQNAGITKIECGSFVSPKAVPQMANSDQVFNALYSYKTTNIPTHTALILNEKGLQRAIDCNVKEIIYVLSASNSFALKNMNCNMDDSYQGLLNIMHTINDKKIDINVRIGIACSVGCPYQGYIEPMEVTKIIQKLSSDFKMGDDIDDIFFCDTIGIGTSDTIYRLLDCVLNKCDNIDVDILGVHFHDTYGQAIANIMTSLYFGINMIECSIAGLGGCPFAKNATGNVATEDVVFLLNGLEIDTGLNLYKLLDASYFITDYLEIKPQSKVANAKRHNEFYDFTGMCYC